jgi:hypothetical protein
MRNRRVREIDQSGAGLTLMTILRHARVLSRPSTSSFIQRRQDVDARDKPGMTSSAVSAWLAISD